MQTTKLKLTVIGAMLALTACASNPRPDTVYVRRRPPAERVEEIGVAPGPGQVWIKGHWAWRGNDYEWMPGRWTVVERGRRDWVPGHWAHDRRNGWYYIDGHWR